MILIDEIISNITTTKNICLALGNFFLMFKINVQIIKDIHLLNKILLEPELLKPCNGTKIIGK